MEVHASSCDFPIHLPTFVVQTLHLHIQLLLIQWPLTGRQPQPDDHVGWCEDGASFRVADPAKFAARVLPRYFKHNKLGSFQQQLLTYGFHRMPNESVLDTSVCRVAAPTREHRSRADRGFADFCTRSSTVGSIEMPLGKSQKSERPRDACTNACGISAWQIGRPRSTAMAMMVRAVIKLDMGEYVE